MALIWTVLPTMKTRAMDFAKWPTNIMATSTTEPTHSTIFARSFCSCVITNAPRFASLRSAQWRKTPYPERQYEALSSYVVCDNLSQLDKESAAYELTTSLEEGFVTTMNSRDDVSEGWMTKFGNSLSKITSTDEAQAEDDLKKDEGVIKAQVLLTMDWMIVATIEKSMNENKVIRQPEPVTARQAATTPSQKYHVKISEQPVWGIGERAKRASLD